MRLWSKFAALLVLACFTTAYAQSAVCTDMVKQALAKVDTACALTGRNQACYGNFALTVTPRDGVQGFTFQKQGDLADVADVASLQLQQLDLKKQLWGIVLMKIQANLPDTLPGQNVTFLLFGDVKITNAVTASNSSTDAPLNPMQAFYFSTGVGKSDCSAAPSSGILIQTPKGAGKISLRANDADIQLGSTAFLRAQAGDKMTMSVVEGEGVMTADGETVVVPAGTEAQVPLDEDLQADGAPDDPQPYDSAEVDTLPVDLMPNDIEIAPPDENIGDTSGDLTDSNGDSFTDNADNTSGDLTDSNADDPSGDLTGESSDESGDLTDNADDTSNEADMSSEDTSEVDSGQSDENASSSDDSSSDSGSDDSGGE